MLQTIIVNVLILWGVIGTAVGLYYLIPYLRIVVVSTLAAREVLWGFCKEGEIKVIMHGESAHRFIMSSKSHWVRPTTGIVVSNKIETRPADEIRALERDHGIYWIGLPPNARFFNYLFSYGKLVLTGKDTDTDGGKIGDYSIDPRVDRSTNYLYHRYQYPMKFEVNLENRAEVFIFLLVTIEIADARKALFEILPSGSWLAKVTGSLEAVVRDYVGNLSLEKLTELQHEKTDSAFKTAVEKTYKLLEDSYGIKIKEVNFKDYGLLDDTVKIEANKVIIEGQKAQAAIETAKKTVIEAKASAEKTIIEAEANKDALILEGTGKAGAINLIAVAETTRARSYLDAVVKSGASNIATAEALSKTPNLQTLVLGKSNVLVGGNTEKKVTEVKDNKTKGDK